MADDDWRHRAACRRHPSPELFFASPARPEVQDLMAICRRECEVRLDCGTHAVVEGETAGIAGGFHASDLEQRRQLHDWVNQNRATGAPVVSARATVVCSECAASFQTKLRAVTRCPRCARGLRPAEPVRAHIDWLHNTLEMSYKQIGEESGVPPDTVYGIARATTQQSVTGDYSARILSVRSEVQPSLH